MALVLAYLEMMPRIQASERLTAISDGAIASGNLPRGTASSMIAKLEAAARGERHRRERVKATPAVLAAMGVGLRTVTKQRDHG